MYCQLLIYSLYQNWFEALLGKLQSYIDPFFGYLIYIPIYSCGWVIYSVISQIRFDISQTLSEIYMSEQVRFVILINQEWWVEVRWQNSIDLLLNDKEFNEKSICFLTREPKLIECIQFLISKRFAALSNWKIVWN